MEEQRSDFETSDYVSNFVATYDDESFTRIVLERADHIRDGLIVLIQLPTARHNYQYRA